MTSVALHGFAPVVTYALRWLVPNTPTQQEYHLGHVAVPASTPGLRPLTVALILYLLWQLSYYLKVRALFCHSAVHPASAVAPFFNLALIAIFGHVHCSC